VCDVARQGLACFYRAEEKKMPVPICDATDDLRILATFSLTSGTFLPSYSDRQAKAASSFRRTPDRRPGQAPESSEIKGRGEADDVDLQQATAPWRLQNAKCILMHSF